MKGRYANQNSSKEPDLFDLLFLSLLTIGFMAMLQILLKVLNSIQIL